MTSPIGHCRRVGFTLVELLTVIVIISVLGTISVAALRGTQTVAKANKTKGTIQKLDTALMAVYESYEERFEKILDEAVNYSGFPAMPPTPRAREVAKLKQHLIWDLMRMEMPSHLAEIDLSKSPPIDLLPIKYKLSTDPNPADPTSTTNIHVKEPVVLGYYRRAFQAAIARNPDTKNSSSELLFMIIANLNPEALEHFSGTEIDDTDGNGLLEFVDGWGYPIRFLRAASGFSDTDRQADVVRYANFTLDPAAADWNGEQPKKIMDADWNNEQASDPDLLKAFRRAVQRWPDPFDPNNNVNRTWFLYPVIISAGPDHELDLVFGKGGSGIAPPTVADDINPFNYPLGSPSDTNNNGVLEHYDNIHNHQISGF